MSAGHPQYMVPPRPKRPASRLFAGLLWLVAAGLAVGATFWNIVIYSYQGTDSRFFVGFWRQVGVFNGEENSPGTIYYGAAEVAGAAFLLLAALLVVLSARRWAAVVAGAFGTGMLANSVVSWFLTALSSQSRTTITIELGLWLLTGAAAVALVAFLISLFERTRPVQQQPMFAPPRPPQPPPPPRWEPQTPKYGVPVQQPPAPEPPASPEPAPEPTSHLDTPERTTAIDPPKQVPTPEPGSIRRKLEGDEK